MIKATLIRFCVIERFFKTLSTILDHEIPR